MQQQQPQVKLIPLFMEKIGNCIRFLEQSSFGRTQENKTKLVQAVRWLFPDPNSPARLIQMLSIVCSSRNTRDPALLLQFITAQLGLDLMQFSKEEQDKFKRYIECFLDLSQQCTDLMKEMPVQVPAAITLAASSTLPSSQPSAGSKREPSSIEAPSLPAPLPHVPPATDSQSAFVVPVKLEPPADYKSNPQGASRPAREEVVVLPILDCSPSSVDPSSLLLSPAYDSDARDYFPAPPHRQDQPAPTSQKQGSQAVVVDLTTKHEGPEKTIVKKEKKKTGPKGPHKKKVEHVPSASPSLPPVPQESKPVESPAALLSQNPVVPPH